MLIGRDAWLTLVLLGGLMGSDLLDQQLQAGDWPQILGPTRNGQAVQERLDPVYFKASPRVNWQHDLGAGFAGPAVVGDRVVVFHRQRDQELVECLSAATGKVHWKTGFEASYQGGFNPDDGPRCVPVIDGGRVYLFGANGDLHCVGLKTGKKHWSRDTYGDFAGNEGYFGAGSTPLVAAGKVIVNVGGRGDAGLVAFNLADGKTAWKTGREAASYSAPTLATVGDRPAVIFVTRRNVLAVDPKTGKEFFRFPFGKQGPTVNASTPLVFDNHLFVTASYGIGASFRKISLEGTQPVWENDNAMSSQYSTCVQQDGYLYGAHGREDGGGAELRCVKASTGKVMWSVPNTGVTHAILAGQHLLLLSTRGQLTLAAVSPEKFQKIQQHQVARGTTRALPALANGRFYFRTSDGSRGQLTCLQVGATTKKP